MKKRNCEICPWSDGVSCRSYDASCLRGDKITEEEKKKDTNIKIIHLTGVPIPSEYEPVNKTRIAEGILGHCARLISWSKSAYHRAYPGHKVIFNANVCTKEDGKIWYGDIDLTLDEGKLKKLDEELDQEIFVLWEMSCRFETEGIKDKEIAEDAYWSSRQEFMR